MLIPERVFPIVACAGESTRYALGAVHLERDAQGSPVAVATDGRRLLVVSWQEPSGEDYPDAVGNVAQVDGFSALVPADAWKEAGKALPKKTYRPILSYVLLDESQVNPLLLGTTDLHSVRRFSPPAVEGRFPKWQEVIAPLILLPKLTTGKGKPGYAVKVVVDAKMLAELLNVLAKMLDDDSRGVTLYLPVNGDAPLQIQATGSTVQALGVLMPLG